MRMPPPTDELPDASYADAVFTVITKRAAIVTGLTAGAIVPCIPLAILGSLGLLATLLFNRGTIELGTSSAITPENVQVAAIVLLLVVVCSSVLGALMGILRRWSVQRGITWKLLVGSHFSTHPGPQTAVAFIVVPLVVALMLHGVSVVVGHLVSIAPALFFMFPLWALSGFLYESVWEPVVFLILRIAAGEQMMWLKREAELVRLLKDDSELFGCRLRAVKIDPRPEWRLFAATFARPTISAGCERSACV